MSHRGTRKLQIGVFVGFLVVAAAFQAFAAFAGGSGSTQYLVISLSAIVMLVVLGGIMWLARVDPNPDSVASEPSSPDSVPSEP